MKNFKLVFFAVLGLFSATAFAQLNLPQPSPRATVKQVVGVSEITIDYSRPAVKGRKVWGDLVPYGKVWRTGANSATSLSLSTDAEIGGKLVKKGDYALFSIPGEKEWTIIINTNEGQPGSVNYKESLDLVRFSAIPTKSAEFKERFEITIDVVSDNEAKVVLKWENLQVSFPITFKTKDLAGKNMDEYIAKTGNLWYDLAKASLYSVENGLNKDKQMSWIDLSISLEDHFYNKMIKAKILKDQGKNADAYTWMLAAKEHGEKNPSGFYDAYKAEIAKALSDWAAFAPKKKKK